jgi:hypothetical protein
MKHLPAIIATIFIAGMLIAIYVFAPCEIFSWNSRGIPGRCLAALGRQ